MMARKKNWNWLAAGISTLLISACTTVTPPLSSPEKDRAYKLTVLHTNDQLTLTSYQLIPVNGSDDDKTIPQNQTMLNLLSPYQEKGQQLVGGKVGIVDQRLMGERSEVRFQPTNLGTLLTEALMEKSGADLAVMNGGGIRSSIT